MESVANNLSQLSASTVLVVGDVMLDRYWFGQASRISPEAPVPVVSIDANQKIDERLGGAGNVATNITALGGKCTLLSIIGEDEVGCAVTDLASASGIDHHFVFDTSIRTTLKLRVMAQNQQLVRVDFESPPSLPALAESMEKFTELLDAHQIVVFSDYGKGGLDNIESMIKLARAKDIPVLVDPKSSLFSRYGNATMVTPNLKEFNQVVGQVTDNDDMQTKAHELMRQHRIDKLLVTLSEHGMVLFSSRQKSIRCKAYIREVYDVCGAGDTVIAVMAMAMAAGLDDHIGLNLATGAASIVVSKLGTAVASIAELETILRSEQP